ncbi:MAG: hypothetical protein A3I26_03875 [Candidatus Yanofskybacteria bacterium RIFCSPLOWO2_02_FULL_43_10]|uniref:Uncharacterized protein n=2 Tax=Parcubacteria group TaxID=1794811 RepID=A0A1G2RPM1_9BACT|nr:MAG: hypothetical protein A2742_01875 [Candidatus Yanofskybacteria bacterium RIFCSPHIGHO2_01_FULL_43_32]OGN10751.1 MAG: hypothetical protein A3C69_04000 [Candidatus Yanofskybacteria bacterium RIFCSPHIGHO2_02_FULL_43_12]OGN17361.1 MAG: hypothetical protein A3E34_00570 [Candidatus Yanofskybacteria bacterium RIFCSPHIGHO2_12_FULL_43_11]OGN29916.1 MAG: hypothetical protein A3I26_03875 [Candidatus Yanofskybacteria bacterium RIFCSPLOWO2_02_FULL_43_10]OGN34221.1 MAG: hypothetical protein A3G51_03920
MEIQKGAKIGLVSRIDFGSKGFRQSVVDAGFEVFRKEGTHFNVLGAGLISEKDIRREMRNYTKAVIESERDKIKDQNEKIKAKNKKGKKQLPLMPLLTGVHLVARKSFAEEEFLNGVADELAKIIPVLNGPDPADPRKQKPVDLFITTSPAFDGELGERIAQLLSEKRNDIRVWNVGGDRFPIRYVNKLLWILTPLKAVWMRGDYYSTAVERVIKDKTKQTSQSSPDDYVVMGFGSSINKPKGELKYQYMSVPACHRLEETRVSENQIGVSILEYPADGSQKLFRTYTLKDLVSKELGFIAPPEGASVLQKKMIETMKAKGWSTRGIFISELGVSGERVDKAMEGLMKKKTFRRNGENWPGVVYKAESKKYYFDLNYVQRFLKYASPGGAFQEDRILSLACMHAGSRETDYDFLVNKVPEIILKRNANIFVDAGDTKEGLKHDLDKKGEIIPGMANNTLQEKFAAHLIGTVIFKVFLVRFAALLKECDKDKLVPQKVAEMVNKALLLFIYILGNHDLWEAGDGHEPLVVFRGVLVRFLTNHIHEHLASQKLPYQPLTKLVEGKILCQEFYDLPSGLKLSIQHPHMSRAKTTSIRPQEMMDYGKRMGCQITIGANFHVSESVDEWDMDLGQCHCQEIGTMKHGSSFERHKMKMVDQGVGFLRVLSRKDDYFGSHRVFMTETAFYGASKSVPPIDSLVIVNSFVKGLGVDPLD